MRWTLTTLLVVATVVGYSHAAHTATGVGPSFNSEQQDVVVFETNADGLNGSLVLLCDVSGDPTPTVTWYRGDDPVDSEYMLSNGTLFIPNIKEGDYANRTGVIYRCEATNTIGEPGFNATIRSRDITVYYAFFGGFMPVEDVSNITFVPTAPGISIAIECRVRDSQPPPVIEWFQGDMSSAIDEQLFNEVATTRFLEGGRWIYIQNINTFPRYYRCRVSNARFHEQVESPRMYFINGTGLVAEMNHVYKEIGNLTGFFQEDLEFSYVASEGISSRFCTFFAGNQAVPTTIAVGTYASLPAPPATVPLECRAGQTEVIGRGTVTVQQRAMITQPPSDNREVIVGREPGNTVTFSCANVGYPATTTMWYLNGARIDSSFVGIDIDGTMLTIAAAQVSHSGVYQCFVSNAVSEANAAWLLEVRTPVAPVATEFNFTDTENGPVRDRQVGALFVRPFGMPFELPVEVEADPCPSVQWSFNGDNIATGEDYTINDPCSVDDASSPFTFMLTVTNLTDERSGSYSAEFTNLAGSEILPLLYITVPVVVTDPVSSLGLSVVNNPEANCLLNASTVLLTCNTNGFPRPSVRFVEGGDPIIPGQGSSQRISQTFADQIQLSDVMMSDESVYRCESTDDTTNRSMDLTLQFCTLPVITGHSVTMNLIVGDELVIVCDVVGIPQPDINWYRGGVNLNEEENVDIASPRPLRSRLVIEGVTTADSGDYTCVWSNDAGNDSMLFRVEINENPLGSLTLEAIIGIAAGGAGLILVIVLVILLLVCVYMCARNSKSGGMDLPYNVSGGKSYTDYSADPRGNVDKDSDEEDGAQPEAFSPEYESLPALRPAAPPMYKPTPSYPHGAPLGGDDIEMMKVPPPDTDSFVGAPAYRRDNGDFRPSPDDFLSEDAQFV